MKTLINRYDFVRNDGSIGTAMHQPVPDPLDMRQLTPIEHIAFMVRLQRLFANSPNVGIAKCRQIRPGILEVIDGEHEHSDNTIDTGLGRLFGWLESVGAVTAKEVIK